MPAFGSILDDGDVSAVLTFVRSLDPSAPRNGAAGEAPAPATSGPALGLAGAGPTAAGVAEGAAR
jgi:hypothetical protein